VGLDYVVIKMAHYIQSFVSFSAHEFVGSPFSLPWSTIPWFPLAVYFDQLAGKTPARARMGITCEITAKGAKA
jgi:hypothetical protein